MRQVMLMSQERRSGSSNSLPAKLWFGEREVLVNPASRKNCPSRLARSESELMP